MVKRQGDSDKAISDKMNQFIMQCEKKAKQSVNLAAKEYEGILKTNTPVSERQTHTQHARDVTKISNFQRDALFPTKDVGYSHGNGRKDGGWYIHFPDVGTQVRGSVGQPPQHFLRKTHEQAKLPMLAIYKRVMAEAFDID